MKKTLFTFLAMTNSFLLFSQEILTLETAQNKALEANWGIKITEKQIEIANNQIFKGNAGMMPVIDWANSLAGSVNQVHQKYLDGRDIQQLGNSYSPLSSIGLAWTLYDGKRMFAIMDRLKTQGQQSILQNQMQIQNTLEQTMQSFYDISRLQKSKEYLNIIIKYYNNRLKLTEERWQIGRGSKLDYLQSKTDLSTQMSNLIGTENTLKVAKIRMNGILSRAANSNFTAQDKIIVNKTYDLAELLDLAKSKNQDLLLLRKTEELNEISQKDASALLKPKVVLNSSFGYSFNKSNVNFLTYNQNIGLNAGLTATWRLFDGHLIKRNIQTTKINNEVIQLQKAQLINAIENDLNVAYSQYESDKLLLGLELENKTLAQENLDISLEKFKLGASTILELNDAQTRFNTVLMRLVNAEYNVNISELQLLKISGQLLH